MKQNGMSLIEGRHWNAIDDMNLRKNVMRPSQAYGRGFWWGFAEASCGVDVLIYDMTDDGPCEAQDVRCCPLWGLTCGSRLTQ